MAATPGRPVLNVCGGGWRPPQEGEEQAAHFGHSGHRDGSSVERIIIRLKQFRQVATRHETLAASALW